MRPARTARALFALFFITVSFGNDNALPNYLKRVQIKVEYEQLYEMATAFGVRALGILLVNSENVRQTSVCRSFRQYAIGGSQRQTEVCRTFPPHIRPTPEFASSIRSVAPPGLDGCFRLHPAVSPPANIRCPSGTKSNSRLVEKP